MSQLSANSTSGVEPGQCAVNGIAFDLIFLIKELLVFFAYRQKFHFVVKLICENDMNLFAVRSTVDDHVARNMVRLMSL